MRFILFISVLLFSTVAFAQSNVTIKGKVLDVESKFPLESATVYLTRVQDSTMIDYTISDKNGNFTLNVKKTDKKTRLKVNYINYTNFSKDFENISDNIDIGEVLLDFQSTLLDEVQIVSEVPPIRIKNDTLEFNASSFKVREDANVETLLRQLPGVEIDSEKKITVNGKAVNQILVNGKPFFDSDGKIALQNLPADIINKVQVTDSKTKEQRISGASATSDDLSINFTIDEDKNKGYFGKILAGYGTDDRYESSGLLNYFKGETRISLMAASNNINASGFTTDEIFDSMGNVTSVRSNSSGGIAVNGVSFGGSDKGITQSNLLGLNVTDKWGESTDFNGSYYLNDTSSENKNKTKTVNLLPDNLFTSQSESKSENDFTSHNFNFGFEIKIDSTSTLWISPNFDKSKSKSRSIASQFSVDEYEQLLNDSKSDNYSESDNMNLNNSIYYFKKLQKKGRNFSATLATNFSKNDADNFINSETKFYQSSQEDDIRNQISKSKSKSGTYSLDLDYKEPLNDSLTLILGAKYELNNNDDIVNTYDYISESSLNINDLLSNEIYSDVSTFTPAVGLELRKSKYRADINTSVNFASMKNNSDYLGVNTELDKNYVMPNVRASFRYTINKSKSISTRYNYRQSLPNASQLLPVENLSNPLNTIVGNPNLELNKSHGLSLSYNGFDYASNSGIFAFVNFNKYDSRITSVSTFDEDRKRTTTYTNISGTYAINANVNYNKTIKTESGNKYGITAGLNSGFNFNKGFTNGNLYEAEVKTFTPRLEFRYELGEILTVFPNYSVTFSQTDYKFYQINQSSNVRHRFGLETTSFYPENWTFGNDFGYTYNSNIAPGFKKDFFLWNTSLAYTFWDKKMTAKVKVYDLLNQNVSNSRRISEVAIVDTEDIVLQQYVMFSLSYKLESFAKKKVKPEQNRRPSQGRGTRSGGGNRIIRGGF